MRLAGLCGLEHAEVGQRLVFVFPLRGLHYSAPRLHERARAVLRAFTPIRIDRQRKEGFRLASLDLCYQPGLPALCADLARPGIAAERDRLYLLPPAVDKCSLTAEDSALSFLPPLFRPLPGAVSWKG